MIRLTGISITFNKGAATEVEALKETDLEISKGEFVVIVGANGSGKSTLLNLIAGTYPPGKGHIFIDGADVTAWPDFKRSRFIARVFQNPLNGTATELSILDNFRLAALRTRRKTFRLGTGGVFRKGVMEQIAGLGLGLEKKLDQPMGSLSGGQRQALTLLMAVMDETGILLMDEPTAALDPRSSEMVMNIADTLIRDYRLTALMVTHSLKDACRYGSGLILMSEGNMVRKVTPQEKAALTPDQLVEWFS